MSTPVYNQQPTLQNRPMGRKDAQGNLIPSFFTALAFRATYSSTEPTYEGYARPGASESSSVWQISLRTYDGSGNLTSITWPQDSSGNASSDFEFSWTNRASYTYS